MAIKGGREYTVSDIEELPEGERAELIDGEMFMMASPTLTHQEILGELLWQIKTFVRQNKGKCRVLPAPFAVYVKDDIRNYVEPDISVICDRDKLDEKGCHGAPDWVIEIISPSSKHMDYVGKLALYREAGVREYWIVDSLEGSVSVYDLEGGKEQKLHSLTERVKVGIYDELIIDFSELDL